MTPGDRLAQLSILCTRMHPHADAIDDAAEAILATLIMGGTVYVAGNGGSMSQAQHLAAELTGRYRTERRPLPAVALGSNPAHMSCVANDYGYEQVFARELDALLVATDCTVLLSTSGRSPNILAAAEVAHGRASTVAIVGMGHALAGVDHLVSIPTRDTALIQEMTLSAIHSICEAIDEAMGEA